MDKALLGFLIVFGVMHLILIVVPIVTTLKAPISLQSRLAWCLFLTGLPFIAVAIFHFRYKSSLFRGKGYEISAAEERARSGTLAPRNFDD